MSCLVKEGNKKRNGGLNTLVNNSGNHTSRGKKAKGLIESKDIKKNNRKSENMKDKIPRVTSQRHLRHEKKLNKDLTIQIEQNCNELRFNKSQKSLSKSRSGSRNQKNKSPIQRTCKEDHKSQFRRRKKSLSNKSSKSNEKRSNCKKCGLRKSQKRDKSRQLKKNKPKEICKPKKEEKVHRYLDQKESEEEYGDTYRKLIQSHSDSSTKQTKHLPKKNESETEELEYDSSSDINANTSSLN